MSEKRSQNGENEMSSKRLKSDDTKRVKDYGLQAQLRELERDKRDEQLYNTVKLVGADRKEISAKEQDVLEDNDEDKAKERKKMMITHLGAEDDYKASDRSFYLQKEDLGAGVDGITQFNLKEEMAEGSYDGNGNYTWKKVKDEDEELINADPFLRDLDKNGLAVVPEKKETQPVEKEISQNMQFVRLCSCLQEGETPAIAMNRLGKTEKKGKKSRHRLVFERVEEREPTEEEKQFYKHQIDIISEACSVLIEEFLNIYEMSREDIKRLVVINYATNQKRWEYKWQIQPDGTKGESEVYGVFNTAQMIEWHEMGCFVSNPLIRRVKEEKEESTFSAADFDAAFDTEETEDKPNPWIPAEEIDYFTDYCVCCTDVRITETTL